MRNPFSWWDWKNKYQRVIELYHNTPSLDWSLYPDEVVEKSEEYKLFLEKETVKAMKFLNNKK